MKTLTTLITSVGSLVIGTALNAQAVPSINAPLTKEQKEFVLKHSPILIQPDFEAGYDNVVPFNFANPSGPNEQPNLTFDEGTVEAAREKLESQKSIPANEAVVDWDYIEVGGAVSLNFMFFRPISESWGSDRRADTESAVLIAKKNKIGRATETGFPERITQSFTNAHGTGISAACDANADACLVDISASESLKGYTRNQTKKRILEVIDGRTAIVSEHYTHAMVPLTDIKQLVADINVKKAVVYYPVGADIAEMKKHMSGATFVAYSLRDQELASILIANSAKILGKSGSEMNFRDPVESIVAGVNVKIVDGIRTELRNAKGENNGANGYWGWAPAPMQTKNDGTRHRPKNRKDGADGQDRPHAPALHIILGRALFQYFTAEEIAAGALKPVRNGFMVEVK